MDPYRVLGLPQSATAEEIKRRYQLLAKQLHPDKGAAESTEASPPAPAAAGLAPSASDFLELQTAWEALRTDASRATVDVAIKGAAAKMHTAVQVAVDVDLDDMEFAPEERDEQGGVYSYRCRCGDHFVVTEGQLEGYLTGGAAAAGCGSALIECSSCSLQINVLFEDGPADDHES